MVFDAISLLVVVEVSVNGAQFPLPPAYTPLGPEARNFEDAERGVPPPEQSRGIESMQAG